MNLNNEKPTLREILNQIKNNISFDSKYVSPEEMFYIHEEIIIPEISLSDDFEIIIMMGYPGSGKSTIAKHISDTNDNYIVFIYKLVRVQFFHYRSHENRI